MSTDAFRSISQHLDAVSRLNLAQVDKVTYEAAKKYVSHKGNPKCASPNRLIFHTRGFSGIVTKNLKCISANGALEARWYDVHSMILDSTTISVWGDTFLQKFDNFSSIPENDEKLSPMQHILGLCPCVRRFYIQKQLTVQEIDNLKTRTKSVRKLYISADNFLKIGTYDFTGLEFPHLTELIVSPTTETSFRTLQFQMQPSVFPIFLPPTVTSVTLIGLVLTESLLQHILSLRSLSSLNLIGSVIDSKLAMAILPALVMKQLDELSLPPSFYSISSREKNRSVAFSLRKASIQRLSLYVEQFEDSYCVGVIKNHLPPTLEDNVKMATIKNIQIKYASSCSSTASIVCQGGDPFDYRLFSHFVYSYPYTLQTNDAVQLENWQFDLAATVQQLETPRPRRQPAVVARIEGRQQRGQGRAAQPAQRRHVAVREPGAAADQPDGPPQAAPQNEQNGQAQANAPARRPAPRARRSLPAMPAAPAAQPTEVNNNEQQAHNVNEHNNQNAPNQQPNQGEGNNGN
ncbi:hypothetical protein WR25_15893 [Diploscapter pachys]|uniref:Uncharacterized protein n=1 Tax=Diploscapter pachys TaxID=2018661 RepID=A0A2A2L8D8_9BILA|nr:hypothetical protein WR25_15893 [Diploscapter pachys]